MARPNKIGIDYFPFDVDFFLDDKIQLIEGEFGMKGGYITIRLLCKIYKNGYYYTWGADECLLFTKNIGVESVSKNNVDEVVKGLLRRGFFDETVFKSFGVLTSKGIQRRYVQATSERKEVEINTDYWLIEQPKNVPKIINLPTNEVNRPNNEMNRSINPHSKVKEIKLNYFSLENATCEISDREREIFFEILFFQKGIKSAKPEVERFINHYQSTGWLNKNGVAIHDRYSLLRNWDTKGAVTFPSEFIKKWKEIYELSAKLNPLNDYIDGKTDTIEVDTKTLAGLYGLAGIEFEIPKSGTSVQSTQFLGATFDTLPFTGKWANFIGKPNRNFKIMIYGKAGSGKSTIAIKFAHYLASNVGLRVLYVAGEEKLGHTLREKVERLNAATPNLYFNDKLPKDLSKFDVVFIDSINTLALEPADLESLPNNKAYVWILQCTKTGNYRGSQAFEHNADAVIEVANMTAQMGKNRFGGKERELKV